MQKSGHANAIQYGWALNVLCETPDEVRALMESMKQNGVMPGVSIFTLLIQNLLYDGDIVAAKHVYDIDMPEAGIEPDDRAKKTMAVVRKRLITARAAQFKLKKKTDH